MSDYPFPVHEEEETERAGRRTGTRSHQRSRPPQDGTIWPKDLPSWFAAYPRCLNIDTAGERKCERRPLTPGNFHCLDHGGGTKVAVEAAKKRYVLWCLCGEPCLNPTFFNVIVGMWVQKLNDQIIEMPLSLQMRLLETTLEILRELNYVTANYVEVDSPDEK